MLAFLLGFLGIGAAAAAAGGGGGGGDSSAPVKQPQIIVVPTEDPAGSDDDQGSDTIDAGMDDDTMDHGDHGTDTVDAGMDDDHIGHGDDTVDAGMDDDTMDHGDHGTDTVDAGMDDDHIGHGDDTVDAGMDDDTMDHGDHGTDTVDAGMDDDHMGHGDDTVDAGVDDDHMGHGDDTVDAGVDDDHMGHGDDTVDAGMDHGDHDMGFEPIVLPETEAEIDAFVEAVMASPEMHSHGDGSSKAGEHMAAMDLVSRDEITHIAIGHGDWDDPSNWYNGEIPGDGARVLIPEGIHMTYDHVSEARLFTLRVDGKLEFSTEVNSQMVVDTIVISPSGTLQIGTEENPVDPNVNVDIIFANNGAIDTDWDPMLLSRGMIAHGEVVIHGAEKDSHEKVINDPMAGDTWVDMGENPQGWQIGDTIVIAGTDYEGYYNMEASLGYSPPEDEVRVITDIQDGMVFFDDPLIHDHATPREDLKTSVANYTRNISFETEDAELAEVYERGHVMFMHNDDVDVRYAEFHELGRTDKSEPARNVDEFNSIEFDSNVKGRYAFHFHRAGMEDQDNPGMSVGNAVYGSPGWGFVHHDSNAIFDNNASYDTFGAGYVAESGNETGAWTDNIAIFAQGTSWRDTKLGNDLNNFDLAQTGDGFWFQSRMVESVDNIAASVNNGFVYFHRGGNGETFNIPFDANLTDIAGVLSYTEKTFIDDHPILSFSGNEVFASNLGLSVLKANPLQGHDVHSVLEDFTAWNVDDGVTLAYTAHYTLKDFDLIGNDPSDLSPGANNGILLTTNAFDITIVDTTIENFDVGFSLEKKFVNPNLSAEAHDFNIVNPTLLNVDEEFEFYDPAVDDIIASEDIPYLPADIKIDGPLTYKEGSDAGAREIVITGTKSDSLGETDFPGEVDNYRINWGKTINILEKEGYYTTEEGQNYFLLDLYFSDRLTGDIFVETHPVLLDDNVPVDQNYGFYKDAGFNGTRNLDATDGKSSDAAELWATLTDGQLVLTDKAIEMEEEHLQDLLDDAA